MLFSEDTWEAPKWFEHVKYEMLTRHLLDIPGSGPNLPFLSLLSPSLYANPPPSFPAPEWSRGFSAFSPEYSAPRITAPRPRGPPVRQAATCPMVVSSIPHCPGPAETYKQVGREQNAPSEENGKLWDAGKNTDPGRTSGTGFTSRGMLPTKGAPVRGQERLFQPLASFPPEPDPSEGGPLRGCR